jgi:2-iminobutanoate/2-iminopropanoate deaminase
MRTIGVQVSLALALTLSALSHASGRDYLKDDFPQSRGFSTGVLTEGGKTLWLAGLNALEDEQGKSLAGNLEGQARVTLRKIDAALKRAGGSLKNVVSLTVYLTDPRQLDPLVPIYREFWPDGNFPAKTTITVPTLARMGLMLEITAVAVIGDK